jgi:hypothetical protein
MGNKIPTAIEMGLDTVNLGLLIYGSYRINKSLTKQNQYALAMISTAVGVSVSNTLWIIHKIKQNGVKINDISRADGKSGNSRDGSGSNRINL